MDSEIKLIDNLIEEGQKFNWSNFCQPDASYPGQYGGTDTPDWLAWKTRSRNTVDRICKDSSPARALVAKGASAYTQGNGPEQFESAKSNLLKALELTRTALESDVYGELAGPITTHRSASLSNRVFVVHGHDSELKADIERFLHEIGLEPVVLHRQVDEGATIIEKFEKHADVGYAFILLTPDEVAYTITQLGLPEQERDLEKRARPNVIFEFGYFVGRLGRSRVCCLHKGEVAIPSDLSGLVYKKVGGSIDEQAYSIIRELKAAGYDVQI
ncbi:TIR domain-containing protein [Ectothiorhodospira shaposhnikovii]|uniref:TIR domain-containing protein n=1 Tax=Ectothiorhodospira shaposhnikovii TaxID=1054 RepID=UPI001EE8048B|nr:nucleotide-binding protein [Ectothiorhodospira shaposhnikovii]MCG5513751.1 nucleotide-binding protein [Ectothiorhodospira shaposhnikovii]